MSIFELDRSMFYDVNTHTSLEDEEPRADHTSYRWNCLIAARAFSDISGANPPRCNGLQAKASSGYDRLSELKAFDATKDGVNSNSRVTSIPWHHQQQSRHHHRPRHGAP
ncbi:hypothetical protein PR202_gb13346 [Eleusine coracana subsp. coracana]|uniref:Uncharacterized protein n=1 Tax=Eleusine coracana subsp. coracana TaxID=191504 RepID=A0AAV5ETI0_ELECO|nr:hypothetical protein PR202_gb13346 [Eleusine coracana subsp. coracana]